MSDQEAQLDELRIAVVAAQGFPARVVDVPGPKKRVDGGEQGAVPVAPPLCIRAGEDSLQDLPVHSDTPSDPDVMVELVLAVSQVGDAQDHELGLVTADGAAWHHP